MYIDLKTRFKNPGFILAFIAGLLLVANEIAKDFFGIVIDNDKVMILAKIVLFILGMFGIINNPTTASKWFSDDVPDTGNEDVSALFNKVVELIKLVETALKPYVAPTEVTGQTVGPAAPAPNPTGIAPGTQPVIQQNIG